MNYDTYRIPELRELATAGGVADIAEVVISHPQFATWSGAPHAHKHHYGKGGLQQHTWEVCNLAVMAAAAYMTIHPDRIKSFETVEGLDMKVLFLAALFHDVGKIWDYQPVLKEGEAITNDTAWEPAPHRRMIHHISRSVMIWNKAVQQYPQYESISDAVIHCILSHHGQREYGSPVMPATREAWILHHSDCLSARMNDCDSWDQTKK